MEKGELDELLKIRAKANLSAETDYRYTSLENYLSAQYTLALYSEEERSRLTEQLREMPESDKQELLKRVFNRTHPNVLHLSDEERAKLEQARKGLSLHERAQLSDKFIFTASGVVWMDVGEVFQAEIEIDDDSSPTRRSQPYAYISFSNGYWRRVEIVDILESIRDNPASIGHPAIVFAIYHWQRAIRAKRVFKRDDVTSRDEAGKSFKRIFEEEGLHIAERNLAAVSKVFIEGAKRTMLPNEAALAVRMKMKGIRINDHESVLRRAWEMLGAKFIDPIDEINIILQKLEKDLVAFERKPYIDNQRRQVPADRIMEFLRKKGGKGGRRYVGNNSEGISKRPSWKEFVHSFAAWFFNIKRSSVQGYLEKAARQQVGEEEIYQPSFVSPKTSLPSIMQYLLAFPLTTARAPVNVHESQIGFHGLDKAIEESDLQGEVEVEGK